jgi:hypothetical protein
VAEVCEAVEEVWAGVELSVVGVGPATPPEASQCAQEHPPRHHPPTLTNVSSVNMPTKPMLNSSRKIVSARHVSMMALLSFSRTRSSSISRSVPRNTWWCCLAWCGGGVAVWWRLVSGSCAAVSAGGRSPSQHGMAD